LAPQAQHTLEEISWVIEEHSLGEKVISKPPGMTYIIGTLWATPVSYITKKCYKVFNLSKSGRSG